MSKIKTIHMTCDCGCGYAAIGERGWFVLSQRVPEQSNIFPAPPRLERKLHFASLGCLAKWARNACQALPRLQDSAKEDSVRGNISDPKVIGLFV